jgi:hypothetical protein
MAWFLTRYRETLEWDAAVNLVCRLSTGRVRQRREATVRKPAGRPLSISG